MFSALRSSQALVVLAVLVGFSGGAQASEIEPDTQEPIIVDDLTTGTVPCVSLVGQTLDLRILAGGTSIFASNTGSLLSTLDVAVGSGSRPLPSPVNVTFETLSETAMLSNGTTEQWLTPTVSWQAVSTSVTFRVGVHVSVYAYSNDTTQPTAQENDKPLVPKKKVVIRPVTTCPTA